MIDRASARQHQAERAGLEARRDAGEHRALVPVAPHVGDDRLVEASEQVISGVLAADPRERRVSLPSEYQTVPRDGLCDVLHLVSRHGKAAPRDGYQSKS